MGDYFRSEREEKSDDESSDEDLPDNLKEIKEDSDSRVKEAISDESDKNDGFKLPQIILNIPQFSLTDFSFRMPLSFNHVFTKVYIVVFVLQILVGLPMFFVRKFTLE